MTDTHPLQFSDMPVPPPTAASGSSNLAVTPSRRGHSHRRSFAVSGDFEFLKQCPPGSLPASQGSQWSQGAAGSLSVPPLPRCASPDPVSNAPDGAGPRFNATDFEKPTSVAAEVTFLDAHTPRKISHGLSSPSPRFFISEEPKFTSPVKGVPDAIINLDDALKTKPKSFKSHRRSESAPADLEIVMNFKNGRSIPDFRIDEEDGNNNEDGEDSQPQSDDNDPQAAMPFGLMSPLRPSSPAFKRNYQLNEQAASNSPTRLVFHQHHTTPTTAGSNTPGSANAADKYNSLKIKRQKQRYYHYTKQLPTNITVNTAQPSAAHALQEKTSTASLGSAMSKTPASFAQTPSNTVNSPVTPLSNREFNPHPTNCNNSTATASAIYSSSSENTMSSGSSNPIHSNNSGGEQPQRRARSPDFSMYQQMHQKYPMLNNHLANHAGSKYARRNSGPAVQSSFRFESKVYDMPLDKRDTEQDYPERSVTPRFGQVSPSNDDTFNAAHIGDDGNLSSDESVTSPVNTSQNTRFVLSQDILMGEPGDTVDLSSDPANASTDIVEQLQSFSMTSSKAEVEPRMEQPVPHHSNNNTMLPPGAEAAVRAAQPENRSASDSIVEMNNSRRRSGINGGSAEPATDANARTAAKKKRSKLSIFTNLFSR
ncbi:Lre1 protein [Maudiozyma humilis]|uniref:Lre1 protein n=1 Tax=Maudiozyma humilis TaxID=51915 RepID=A0AAV5S0M7_MAUHU|nr:Lre1 protein [Kazachstania humilis]